MALSIAIRPTNVVSVPDDVAADLSEVASVLADLPVTRVAVTAFDTVEEARTFVRQAKAWADGNGYKFARKGLPKMNPCLVEFRIYAPKPKPSK